MIDKKKTAILMAVTFALLLPMIAFDFGLMYLMGKAATPFTMGGNLAYAFFVMKPLVIRLKRKFETT